MLLRIGNKEIDKYNDVSVSRRYDSVASIFSFDLYFDPNDQNHREAFRPSAYKEVVIENDGQRIITGVLLSTTMESESVKKLMNVNGYSKTGVLEDCGIPKSAYPLQSTNINLKNIAEKILKPFGIKLVVDSSVSAKVGGNYKNSTGGDTQSAKDYLSELANQKNVLLTHNVMGDLVLTEANTTANPVFDFDVDGTIRPATKMVLSVNGQAMHSDISLQRQQTKKKSAGKADVTNPYASGSFRPMVKRQSSGDDTSTEQAAKNLLRDELKAIKLTIELSSWQLGGKTVEPNTTITVKDSELFLFQKTVWFIEQVDYKGGGVNETAILTCYLPEVYNGKQPKNIFA